MATSSRQAALFGVNDWKTIYQTFSQADFRSYDYETLRKSFIDYLRIYYPESFNDYTESSEFIALLDVISFMGQGLAFRNDLNARENFLDTAERRDSVVKLANLVSYTPKRNLCAEGLLKVVGIQTTQNITDLNGVNLSNLPILWNDPANSSWFEQFNTIINAALISAQKVGKPGNVADILGVTTAEYSLQIPQNTLPIVPFSSTINGVTTNFELVTVSSVDRDYLYELPPAPTGKFNMVYRNDNLGFASANTGYFFYFKQGRLSNYDFVLQQQISNQTVDINIQGINNTDTWLYQLNDNNSTLLWKQVDNIYADAYLQTETSKKNIFSVTSRFNDQVTYVFGDGVFSNIPVGTFRAYVRASNALTYVINPTEMNGINIAFTYISREGMNETLTVSLQLQQPVTTAQARESLPDIKQRAPTRYYTQNRMVNGEDYNNFPYTLYSSIIKSKAINRSSVGVSKNLDLLDPTGKYSSTTNIGDDGAIWQDDAIGFIDFSYTNTNNIINFFTDKLANILISNRTEQYYVDATSNINQTWYKRFTTGSSTVYWNNSNTDASSVNGYFYTINNTIPSAVMIGTYSTTNMKYVTKGATIQFTAPTGYYFDKNNRLVAGISNNTTLWTTVLSVVGDGSNGGQGNFSNGIGPVTLNAFVPSGVYISSIIPMFDNLLNAALIQEAIIKIANLQENFTLAFNNSLLVSQERWTIESYDYPDWFVRFTSQTATNSYLVEYRSLQYYFGSVSQTRFTYAVNQLVYDPFSGKILQDYINVLGTNTEPDSSTTALGVDTKINIVGQTIQSDGYVNDFEVEVASTDVNNKLVIMHPDFFADLTGVQAGYNNAGKYVFFVTVQDAVNLTRQQLVPSGDILYQYAIKNEIELVKYSYPEGQLFYAYGEDSFYQTIQDITTTTKNYIVTRVTGYSMMPGRQALTYQYRHNSNNTTRIDPATTNIIDLYVVTQAYYTAYQKYIQDSTDTIPEPDRPTIAELSSEYSQVNDYKMLSDSTVLNSVVFKPLFGAKAAPALRGTIKVIKTSDTTASDSEIISAVLTTMNSYFDVNNWNFGDTFYFSELSAYLHDQLGDFISSAVLVPNDPNESFGTLYEIKCRPYEIFVNGATADNITVIAALTPDQLKSI